MNINGLFNPENKFWSFMEKMMNLCAVAFLWLLFSLPLVTLPASTAALFQYTLRMANNEEGYVWKGFVRGFKENFVQATVLGIGAFLLGVFLVTDLYLCQYLQVHRAIRFVLTFALLSILIVYLLTIIYLIPLVSFFRVTIKKAVSNSFVMAVGNLYISVTILVIYGIAAVIAYYIPALFMVWFSMSSYAASHLFRGVFEKYVTDWEENEH